MTQDADSKAAATCEKCGGQFAATHMLTRTYDLGGRGQWRRQLSEFVEDVAVVCKECGHEAQGRMEVRDDTFVFIPGDERHDREAEH